MSNAKKPTPGPWIVAGDMVLHHWSAEEADDGGDAFTEVVAMARVCANARLIAAAPELLDALELLFAYAEEDPLFDAEAVEIARAAIAKARGEE